MIVWSQFLERQHKEFDFLQTTVMIFPGKLMHKICNCNVVFLFTSTPNTYP
jgi:hypothetical protein